MFFHPHPRSLQCSPRRASEPFPSARNRKPMSESTLPTENKNDETAFPQPQQPASSVAAQRARVHLELPGMQTVSSPPNNTARLQTGSSAPSPPWLPNNTQNHPQKQVPHQNPLHLHQLNHHPRPPQATAARKTSSKTTARCSPRWRSRACGTMWKSSRNSSCMPVSLGWRWRGIRFCSLSWGWLEGVVGRVAIEHTWP